MKIFATFLIMIIATNSFGESSPGCKEWSHVYNGDAGLEGYYCKSKPEVNLRDVGNCKSWKYTYMSGHGVEGYLCDSNPSLNSVSMHIDIHFCKSWIKVYNSSLPMNGYICRELI